MRPHIETDRITIASRFTRPSNKTRKGFAKDPNNPYWMIRSFRRGLELEGRFNDFNWFECEKHYVDDMKTTREIMEMKTGSRLDWGGMLFQDGPMTRDSTVFIYAGDIDDDRFYSGRIKDSFLRVSMNDYLIPGVPEKEILILTRLDDRWVYDSYFLTYDWLGRDSYYMWNMGDILDGSDIYNHLFQLGLDHPGADIYIRNSAYFYRYEINAMRLERWVIENDKESFKLFCPWDKDGRNAIDGEVEDTTK